MMKLYHKTKPVAAHAILREGFQNGTGHYMTDKLHSGVWLSNVPLDTNDGGTGEEELLELTFDGTEDELTDYEWIEEGKTYREWLVPAVVVNSRMTVRLAEENCDEGSTV